MSATQRSPQSPGAEVRTDKDVRGDLSILLVASLTEGRHFPKKQYLIINYQVLTLPPAPAHLPQRLF